MAAKKKTTSAPKAKTKSTKSRGADALSGLSDMIMRVSKHAGEVLREPLNGLAFDLRESLVRRSAQTIGTGVTAGLRASKGVLLPALRLLVRIPESVDAAARCAAEDDDEDWTILGEEAKNRYRRYVIASIRGLEKFLLDGEDED